MPNLTDNQKAMAGTTLIQRAYVGAAQVAQLRKNMCLNPSFEGTSGTVEVWRNLATNPSFEASSGTVEVWRNLATNPSFDGIGGSLAVEVRRNLVIAPSDTSHIGWNNSGFGTGGVGTDVSEAGTGEGGSSARKTTWTTAASGGGSNGYFGRNTNTDIAVTPATLVSGSIFVEVSQAISVVPQMEFYDSGGVIIGAAVSGASTALAAGVGQRLSIAAQTVPALAVRARMIARIVNLAGTTNGFYRRVSRAILEVSPIAGSYFDGGVQSVPDSDLTTVWTGTANASASTLSAALITNASTSGGCVAFGSLQWFSMGARSLRQKPTIATNGSNTRIAGASAALSGQGVTFVAGQTYTITAKLRMPAAQTGSLNTAARRITVAYNGTGGTTVQTNQPANAAGITLVTVTFTLPADATSCDVLAWNGATAGGGDTWWDELLIVNAPISPGYFDGSHGNGDTDLTASWVGTTNASASILSGVALSPAPTMQNSAKGYQSSQWASSGTKALRITGGPSSGNSNAIVAGASGSLTGIGVTFIAGRTYTVSATIRLTAALAGSLDGNARKIRVTYNGTGGGNFFSAAAANAAGVTRLSVTFTVPADATQCYVALYNGAWGGNGDVWWDDLLIVEGTYTGTYFDGGHGNGDSDLTASWTGTTDGSASILTGVGVVSVDTASQGSAFSSTQWAVLGTKSLRIKPGTTSNGSAVVVAGAGASLTGQGVTFVAGRTYTVLTTIRLSGAQTGTLNANARRITATYNGTGGTTVVSTQATNAAGVTALSLTFTVPANATFVYVQLWNGASVNNGDVWWDKALIIEEGSYTKGYFDGSTSPGPAPAFWGGTANASVSYWWSKW